MLKKSLSRVFLGDLEVPARPAASLCSRRSMLRAPAVGVGAWLLGPLLGCSEEPRTERPLLSEGELMQELRRNREQALVHLGAAALADHPRGAFDVPSLVGDLMQEATIEAASRAYDTKVSGDLVAGNVLRVGGWEFAETELTLAVASMEAAP